MVAVSVVLVEIGEWSEAVLAGFLLSAPASKVSVLGSTDQDLVPKESGKRSDHIQVWLLECWLNLPCIKPNRLQTHGHDAVISAPHEQLALSRLQGKYVHVLLDLLNGTIKS